ncbi:MAG: hypothetical protein IPK85_03245 [Gemmatimonadetes bacterium]|nr:hypothetical protein [Gemmatimonadota bacterium]
MTPFVGLDARQLGALWNAFQWCQEHCVIDDAEVEGQGVEYYNLSRLGTGRVVMRLKREGEE